MSNPLRCIMLVDDNADDNFFHERAIRKLSLPEIVILIMNKGIEALAYLKYMKAKDPHPDLIFLDINMPSMSGWEFLNEYNRLGEKTQNGAITIMLTTSENAVDELRARQWHFISDYITKPLTGKALTCIVNKYFK